jgi:hypothetical protein
MPRGKWVDKVIEKQFNGSYSEALKHFTRYRMFNVQSSLFADINNPGLRKRSCEVRVLMDIRTFLKIYSIETDMVIHENDDSRTWIYYPQDTTKSNVRCTTISKKADDRVIGKDMLQKEWSYGKQPQRRKHMQGAFKYRRNRGTPEDSSVK